MHLSAFVHLNTVTMRHKRDNTKTNRIKTNRISKNEERTWSSEHRCNQTMVMSAEERRATNLDARDISICTLPDNEEKKKVTKDGGRHEEDECEEEMPDSPPCVEEQDTPEDNWFCIHCSDSPCQFLQWQEEIKRVIDGMDPVLSNKSREVQVVPTHVPLLFWYIGQGQL
jgi:hypothetical protein